MTVDEAIKLLSKTYKGDEELMIDWVDQGQVECPLEIWSRSVGLIEGSKEGMIDMNYVFDIIRDAKED